MESTVLILFHADAQLNAQDPVNMTVGEAVRSGLINNETLGYFIVKTWQFLVSIGLKKDCFLKFVDWQAKRQIKHMSATQAHRPSFANALDDVGRQHMLCFFPQQICATSGAIGFPVYPLGGKAEIEHSLQVL